MRAVNRLGPGDNWVIAIRSWYPRSMRRRAGALIVVTLAGTAWLGAVPGHAAAPPPTPRPNLVVTAGRLSLPDAPKFGFALLRGTTTLFAWNQRTENVGNAATRRISQTGVRLLFGSHRIEVGGGGRLAVPKLRVDKSFADNSAFRIFWKWSDWEYGTYPTRICADIGEVISESHEKDNCHKTHPIYVIPGGVDAEHITGTATQPFAPDLQLNWTTDARFPIKPIQPV